MKKIVTAVLSAVLVVSIAPPLAFADDAVALDDPNAAASFISEDSLATVVDQPIQAEKKGPFDKGATDGTWSFENGVLTINNSTKINKGELISPSQEYLSATKKLVIGDGTSDVMYEKWFARFPNAEELSLPKSCTVLPALADLKSLNKISYPDGCGITSLMPGAFAWAGEDPNFYGAQFDVVDLSMLPLTEIPKGTFRGSLISEVKLPDTLKQIKATAFTDMKYLKSIEIPSSVEEIGVGYVEENYAGLFDYDTSLSTVVMYDTVKDMKGPFWKYKANGTTIEIIGTNVLSDSFSEALSAIPSDGTVKFQQVFNVNPDGIEAIANNVQPVDTQWVEMGAGLDAAGAESSNAPVLSCDGYIFTGWYSDVECTTPYDFTAPMEHGAVAYAGWKQIVSVDVNYGNGSENGTITADENGMIVRPDTDPIRAGYKFAGWFSDETCTAEFDFEQPVADGTCLYAGWTPVKATVSNVDGTKTDLQVKSDGTIAEPMAPTRDGYVFKGWYSDPYCTQAFDFAQPLYDDVTLYSKWEAKASEPTTPGGSTDAGDTGSGSNAQQAGSTNNAGVQTFAQTSDAATGAVSAVAFISAMAAAVVAFARKRIARR